ncbi:preprotein translocase subunit YajC [Corynebacterium suicordis]|uniref:Preprotein translocase subunit YajC n=1 Tax=Corynebacterium suicordis DSM 45110 TaxID=1121369 RepID=A0ABR9ZK93_9CORY|nr:preprotein translocase subunit YajC [Corynebacterium suicordis]MBF4553526.1 preprotein translocase subunit YajC [Corynebacterium suicordis DSM 45110]MDR6277500.1 preprotein translocase subunit YajC [Corynebacterium suicordis]
MDVFLLGLLLVVFVALPLISMRKQNRRVKEIQAFQERLHPGMVVKTTSGMHARIAHVGETTVDLEISAGVVSTWDKAVVLSLVETEEPAAATPQQAEEQRKDPETPEESL